MAKVVKKLIVEELRERLQGVDGWVLVDTTGLDAQSAEGIRTELREAGLRMIVLRNSLARKVFEEMGVTVGEDHLQGPTALLYGGTGALSISRVLIPWRKKRKLLRVRGGLLDGQVVEPREVERLASIPDMPVLRSQLYYLLGGTILRLHFAMAGPIGRFSALMAALSKKKEKAAG